MEKFLITQKSCNRITGPILVTTSPRRTCPNICPFKKSAEGSQAGVCYAEHGFLGGFIWSSLDRLPVGGRFKQGQIVVHSLDALLDTIRSLPEGAIWRHNQAGDLPTVDGETIDHGSLQRLVDANRGKRGFTYTHFDVLTNPTNAAAVRDANENGFFVNLSGNSPAHADSLVDAKVGPVTCVVPNDQMDNTETPRGRKIVICPARTRSDVTCKTCGLCARLRDTIVGFPSLGRRKHMVH